MQVQTVWCRWYCICFIYFSVYNLTMATVMAETCGCC